MRNSAWTEEEISFLKKNYPILKSKLEMPNRTVGAIRRKAYLLGVNKPRKRILWSEAEEQLLMDLSGTSSDEEISAAIGRSRFGVKEKRLSKRILRKKNDKWSEEELMILERYETMGKEMFSLLPKRTEIAIRSKIGQLGIKMLKKVRQSRRTY